MSHNTTGFLWTTDLYMPLDSTLKIKLNKKQTLKASFFSKTRSKLFETESLAEVQFVIDSCRFGSQSNYLNNSNKDYDWFILAGFIREHYTADATFTRLENEVWLENTAECVGKSSLSCYTASSV